MLLGFRERVTLRLCSHSVFTIHSVYGLEIFQAHMPNAFIVPHLSNICQMNVLLSCFQRVSTNIFHFNCTEESTKKRGVDKKKTRTPLFYPTLM